MLSVVRGIGRSLNTILDSGSRRSCCSLPAPCPLRGHWLLGRLVLNLLCGLVWKICYRICLVVLRIILMRWSI